MFISLILVDWQEIYPLILILVEKEIILCWVIRPDVFYTFIDISFILYFLKILQHLQGCSRPNSKVNQFFLSGGPGCIFEL